MFSNYANACFSYGPVKIYSNPTEFFMPTLLRWGSGHQNFMPIPSVEEVGKKDLWQKIGHFDARKTSKTSNF